MIAQEVTQYTVGVEYGNPENHIIIKPPLSDEIIERMVVDGILVQTFANRSTNTGETTRIPFGRLILGVRSMDDATRNYASQVRQYLPH